MDSRNHITDRLVEIQKFLHSNATSPRDLIAHKHVQFLVERLLATEHESVRLLGLLQDKVYGKAGASERRLVLIREKASKALETGLPEIELFRMRDRKTSDR